MKTAAISNNINIGAKSGSSLNQSSGEFLQTLDTVREGKPGAESATQSVLASFERGWSQIDKKSSALIQRLPSEARAMVELQVVVNKLHMRSMMATKAAESVSNTVKRMQQMGSS